MDCNKWITVSQGNDKDSLKIVIEHQYKKKARLRKVWYISTNAKSYANKRLPKIFTLRKWPQTETPKS